MNPLFIAKGTERLSDFAKAAQYISDDLSGNIYCLKSVLLTPMDLAAKSKLKTDLMPKYVIIPICCPSGQRARSPELYILVLIPLSNLIFSK